MMQRRLETWGIRPRHLWIFDKGTYGLESLVNGGVVGIIQVDVEEWAVEVNEYSSKFHLKQPFPFLEFYLACNCQSISLYQSFALYPLRLFKHYKSFLMSGLNASAFLAHWR